MKTVKFAFLAILISVTTFSGMMSGDSSIKALETFLNNKDKPWNVLRCLKCKKIIRKSRDELNSKNNFLNSLDSIDNIKRKLKCDTCTWGWDGRLTIKSFCEETIKESEYYKKFLNDVDVSFLRKNKDNKEANIYVEIHKVEEYIENIETPIERKFVVGLKFNLGGRVLLPCKITDILVDSYLIGYGTWHKNTFKYLSITNSIGGNDSYFNACLPRILSNMYSLKKLDLSNNNLTWFEFSWGKNYDPRAFGNIEEINFSNNKLSDVPCFLITYCSKLKKLDLSFNKIKNTRYLYFDPKILSFTIIEEINFDNNELDEYFKEKTSNIDDFIRRLKRFKESKCSGLVKIILTNNRITKSDKEKLKRELKGFVDLIF